MGWILTNVPLVLKLYLGSWKYFSPTTLNIKYSSLPNLKTHGSGCTPPRICTAVEGSVLSNHDALNGAHRAFL